jgi:hypothetical protein
MSSFYANQVKLIPNRAKTCPASDLR